MGLLLYIIIGAILAIYVTYNTEFTDDASAICVVSCIIVLGSLIFITWPVFIAYAAIKYFKE